MNHNILMHDALLLIGPSNCIDSDIWLVGGEGERDGRVEICYNGVWGTVCADNGWDEVDANVVCQQLGITNQRALPTNDSRSGDGEGPILLENVRCNQQHSNLSQCVDFRFTGTSRDCKHTAGVICSDENITMSTPTKQVLTILLSYDTYSNGSGSLLLPLLGSLGALVIIGVIAAIAIVIIMVVTMRKRVGQTENR